MPSGVRRPPVSRLDTNPGESRLAVPAGISRRSGTQSLHDFSYPAITFDEGDIRRCLAESFDKGRSYQRDGAVRELRADKGGQRLIASVRGNRPRPYHVFVEIADSEPVSLTARCTCPVGWNCKHAAAVLLEALTKPPPLQQAEQDPLSGAVGGWLHQLRAAAHPPASPEAIAYRFDLPPHAGSPSRSICVSSGSSNPVLGAPIGTCPRRSCKTRRPTT